MLISRYQLSDPELESLEQLLKDVEIYDHGLPAIYWHLLILRRDTPSNLLYYSTAKSDQPQLVGFLSLYFFYEDKCEISLVVHPDYRHQGIAHQLLKAAYSTHLNKNIKQLIFSSAILKEVDWQKRHHITHHHTEYHLKRTQTQPIKVTSSKLTVRTAMINDIEILCQLDEACFKEHDLNMSDRFLTLLSDDSYTVLVAELNQTLIGKAHLRFDDDTVTLSDLAVSPAYQHQGYGGELLSQAINTVLKKGLSIIELDVETDRVPQLDLYLKYGFEIERKTYFYIKSVNDM